MTHFVEITENERAWTVDGYSTCKTLRGVFNDIARIAAKIDPNQADGFIVRTSEEAEELLLPASRSHGEFFVEVEPVACAVMYHEDKETEYADAENYFAFRLIK